MMTFVLGILYFVSLHCLSVAAFETLGKLIVVCDTFANKKSLTKLNFTSQLWMISIGLSIFTFAVILTLIRYGIFKA